MNLIGVILYSYTLLCGSPTVSLTSDEGVLQVFYRRDATTLIQNFVKSGLKKKKGCTLTKFSIQYESCEGKVNNYCK